MNCFVFGSNIAQRIMDEKARKLYEIQVKRKVLWLSPFSLCSNRVSETKENPTSLTMDIDKNFFDVVKREQCDYFICDLNAVLYPLIKIENEIYTKNNFFIESSFYKENIPCETMLPLQSERDCFKDNFERFIELLLLCYSSEKIILIKATHTAFYFVNNQIKVMEEQEKENAFLEYYESLFIEKTGCKVIDLAKFYCADKNVYGEGVHGCAYEDAFYEDVNKNLSQMMKNDSNVDNCNIPDYELMLRRYLRVYHNVKLRNMEKIFFIDDDIADRVIKDLSREVIERYKKELAEIKRHRFSDVEQILKEYDYTDCEELKEIIEAVCGIYREDYYNSRINYKVIFTHGLSVVSKVIAWVKSEIMVLPYAEGAQINHENVYNWFLLLKIRNEMGEEAAKELAAMLIESKNPCTVDVWGSCISREVLNHDTKSFNLGVYVFRNSILHAFDKPILHEEKLFKDQREFNGSNWRLGVVKGEFERYAVKRLTESNSDWLVMDLFDITERTYQYKDQGNFIVEPYVTEKCTWWDNVKKDCKSVSQKAYSDEQIKKTLDQAIHFLRSRYGERIILIGVYWQCYYIDWENKIQPLKRDYMAMWDNSRFVKKWEVYLQKGLDCYYCDLAPNFLGDEMFPIASSGAVHYEGVFYDEVLKLIQTITKNLPEQKIYSDYSPEGKVERFLRFLPKNRNNPVTYKILHQDDLDMLLFQSDLHIIEKYKEVIVAMYKCGYKRKYELLSRFPFQEYHAEELYQYFVQLG